MLCSVQTKGVKAGGGWEDEVNGGQSKKLIIIPQPNRLSHLT